MKIPDSIYDMKCMYCDSLCHKTNLSSMWFHCEKCEVHYYENDDGLIGLTFYKDYKGRRYRFEVLPQKPKTFLFQLKPEFELLYEVQESMNVTPDNVLDKIKHILTFL